jgi:hypothetical protein
VNIHQLYLFDAAEAVPEGGVVGFDGHLMDWLLGLYKKPWRGKSTDPAEQIWARAYAPDAVVGKVVRRSGDLAGRCLDDLRQQNAILRGTDWERMMFLDLEHRGVKYTGGAYPSLGDRAAYFAPGGHARTLKFYLRAPRAVAENKAARLEAFRRYFPDLLAFPGPDGKSYADATRLRKNPTSVLSHVTPVLKAVATAGRFEPAPGSEHAWIRRMPPWRTVCSRVLHASRLVEDGEVSGAAVSLFWSALMGGAPLGYLMMGLATAEVAYRTLVRGESQDQVLEWLLRD